MLAPSFLGSLPPWGPRPLRGLMAEGCWRCGKPPAGGRNGPLVTTGDVETRALRSQLCGCVQCFPLTVLQSSLSQMPGTPEPFSTHHRKAPSTPAHYADCPPHPNNPRTVGISTPPRGKSPPSAWRPVHMLILLANTIKCHERRGIGIMSWKPGL